MIKLLWDVVRAWMAKSIDDSMIKLLWDVVRAWMAKITDDSIDESLIEQQAGYELLQYLDLGCGGAVAALRNRETDKVFIRIRGTLEIMDAKQTHKLSSFIKRWENELTL
jgi:hypothetical protein